MIEKTDIYLREAEEDPYFDLGLLHEEEQTYNDEAHSDMFNLLIKGSARDQKKAAKREQADWLVMGYKRYRNGKPNAKRNYRDKQHSRSLRAKRRQKRWHIPQQEEFMSL